jgi:hypothetical protein
VYILGGVSVPFVMRHKDSKERKTICINWRRVHPVCNGGRSCSESKIPRSMGACFHILVLKNSFKDYVLLYRGCIFYILFLDI